MASIGSLARAFCADQPSWPIPVGHLLVAGIEITKDVELAAHGGAIFNDLCFARDHGMDLQFDQIEIIHITHHWIFSQLR